MTEVKVGDIIEVLVDSPPFYKGTKGKVLSIFNTHVVTDFTGNNFRYRSPLWDVLHKNYRIIPSIDTPITNNNVSDGSTASYYELPPNATELQDLISHKNLNAQIGEIFRECYRYGQASHCDELRGAKKIKFYIDAEIKRLELKRN